MEVLWEGNIDTMKNKHGGCEWSTYKYSVTGDPEKLGDLSGKINFVQLEQ